MLFFRQTWTLVKKNILIVLFRHAFSTPLRCFLLPIIFTGFLAFVRNLFIPPSVFGVGTPHPVQSLANALQVAGGARNKIALVNNGFAGGDIDRVINLVAGDIRAEGKVVELLVGEGDLLTACPTSLRGISNCFGAAIFYSSPSEGPGGLWNYSLRADGGLGRKIDMTKANNEVEIYPLPLQHAIDFAIASINQTVDPAVLPTQVKEYPFTDKTQKERAADIRIRFMGAIIDILAVAFLIGIIGVIYQLVGLMASERELGMTQIIDASMPNKRRWEPRAARLVASHVAFDMMFLPGWVIIGLIMGSGVFSRTGFGVNIIFNVLIGLSLTSFSIFGGAFFRKAQLSGISTTIISLLLGVLAQFLRPGTGGVAVLSLLFPPMNYIFFTVLMARWEREDQRANLLKKAPNTKHDLPGVVFFIILLIQILVFPILGALVENWLHGTASKGRKVLVDNDNSHPSVKLTGFTKRYVPTWWARNISRRFGKTKETVIAVNNLDLTIPQGNLVCILGSNGSGKSTTLDSIAGLNTITEGSIEVNGSGGLGICPQRNILWDDLTVLEHVKIFNRLKSTDKPATDSEMKELIAACDIDRKLRSKSRHLSGGQKRKLQLSMMFTGGSAVCCVDECSSGVDALARQKLWNILLRERGTRTIIFTTHFLDEADLLSDQIAILSRGGLKASGSAVELKYRLGGGYRIHVPNIHANDARALEFEGVEKKVLYDQTIYTLPDSAQAADFVKKLESRGVEHYDITSPTLEEIFFNVAEETEAARASEKLVNLQKTHSSTQKLTHEGTIIETKEMKTDCSNDEGIQLQNGKPITMFQQATTLFRKRWTVFQRNYLPFLAAFLIPVITAALVTLFLKNFKIPGCDPAEQFADLDIDLSSFGSDIKQIVVGPASMISNKSLDLIGATLFGPKNTKSNNVTGLSPSEQLLNSVHPIDGTLDDFNNYIRQNFRNITPGGFWLGDQPTFAYQANAGLSVATFTQNALDILLTNISISTTYDSFSIPYLGSADKTLQLTTYFGLAMSIYPAFFALYPTLERLRGIRQLHYSNGVRSVCLWSAYVTFDFIIVVAISVLSTVIYRAASNAWFHIEYLFVVFFLYGLVATLCSYVVSIFSKSQLAAFAVAAGGQAVGFLVYFLAYMSTLTYAPAAKIDTYISIVHFTIALLFPMASLTRAIFVSVNVFSIDCRDRSIATYPGEITLYGGPILYLVTQSIFLFGLLVWMDSGSTLSKLSRKTYKPPDVEEEVSTSADDEIVAEVRRVNASPEDGLRVIHVSKAYGKTLAVQDVTFGVKRGEVFALLGPNGAGKSTTISLIRGDIRPSKATSSEIFVGQIPLSKRRAAARNLLGVCPQTDACDQMTVLEHLQFYARVRGVGDIQNNTTKVISAVGLEQFTHRMAAKLSGGNKRKLSLAIALMGNPSVLLLDEPSSGMDVCAKRVMWRTLASVVPGRSIVLTTHSMEEADALADRAGIMTRRMLALGTSEYLRQKHGGRYYVHLITTTAPHTSAEEMARIRTWVQNNIPGSIVETRTFHGQLRFSVPSSSSPSSSSSTSSSSSPPASPSPLTNNSNTPSPNYSSNNEIFAANANPPSPLSPSSPRSGIGALFTTLEQYKDLLGFEYYSVSPTTLDQVFLGIVGKHNVEEENYENAASAASAADANRGGWWWWRRRRRRN